MSCSVSELQDGDVLLVGIGSAATEADLERLGTLMRELIDETLGVRVHPLFVDRTPGLFHILRGEEKWLFPPTISAPKGAS